MSPLAYSRDRIAKNSERLLEFTVLDRCVVALLPKLQSTIDSNRHIYVDSTKISSKFLSSGTLELGAVSRLFTVDRAPYEYFHITCPCRTEFLLFV